MKIAIDGMGGDNAPAAVIEGIIQALEEYKDIEMYITGPEKEINEELSKYNYEKDKINVIDATEVISTNEHPVMAVRKKKDSSLCGNIRWQYRSIFSWMYIHSRKNERCRKTSISPYYARKKRKFYDS